MIRIAVKPIKLNAIGLDRRDMAKISSRAMELIRLRVSRGLDVNNRPMAPLSAGYAAKKRSMGQSPIRNMMFSGTMLGSLVPIEITSSRAVVGFTRQSEQSKAVANQNRRGSRWFGLSKSDEQQVQNFADRLLRDKSKLS